MVEVEEIFDAAVPVAERYHRLELLRDHGLARIGEQLGCRRVEQGRVGARLRRGPDRVAEPHVDLEHEARLTAVRAQRRTSPNVLVLGPDRLEADAITVERDSVGRSGSRRDRPKVVANRFERTVAAAQEIEVERRAVGPIRPEPQQHRALQDEAYTAIGNPQAEQEALETVAREQHLVIVAALLRSV
jgi:hypothetical protein